MKKIGIVDTAYSRVDMAKVVCNFFRQNELKIGNNIEIIRATVPGHKELAVGALSLFEKNDCDVCIVFGWVGPKESDLVSAHEAALAIAFGKVKVSRHILECFVFESQHEETALKDIATNRAIAHMKSALSIVSDDSLSSIKSSIGDREGDENATLLDSTD